MFTFRFLRSVTNTVQKIIWPCFLLKTLLQLGTVCQKLGFSPDSYAPRNFTPAQGYFEDALSRLSKPSSVQQRLQSIEALAGLG